MICRICGSGNDVNSLQYCRRCWRNPEADKIFNQPTPKLIERLLAKENIELRDKFNDERKELQKELEAQGDQRPYYNAIIQTRDKWLKK